MRYEDLEPMLSDGRSRNLVTVFEEEEDGYLKLCRKYVVGEDSADFCTEPVLRREGGRLVFQEPMEPESRLIILGGGHISGYLCEFAAKTGFLAWVADEREEFANRERFPWAARVICRDYLSALEEIGITARDYVAIITRGHSCDGDCLRYILNHELPSYLGMIGSKRRVQAQFRMFEEEGIPAEKLALVHNPIGLPIHAVTPAEIAVSILAEMIAHRRGGQGAASPALQTDLDISVLTAIAERKKDAAVVTILAASGSTPRKAGAKMLVYPDGSIAGTIGGGFGESQAIREAVALIGTGRAKRYHFSMHADVAAREGMACGGDMDVLIEDLREEEMR